ncbi:general secretion pathway protein L [Pseudomonas sp. ok272]|uniref:type II secretion system protein GspL n=1 Tax=unclassified Pseudomonas TaxID=196821 RepID=UPI0008AFA6FF|nr:MULTISPECIES: type II secretion system protein GspL [unclassified Pseudomonas]SEN33891.1 general secretion pathway protein L [Pseudomonas sp. ok272]SFM84807.1 general secretion pathway protein L [Pseudomonas sp. ok602]
MTLWLYLTAAGLAEPSEQWPCCRVSTQGERRELTLAEAAESVRGQAVELVLPMEMCSWLLTEKWPTRRRPDGQAVAFAIEEHLSEDLEALHLCVGPRDRQGRYGVWVVNRQRLAGVLALMAGLGISVDTVQVDADRLPSDQPYGVWWLGRWLLGGALEARLALSAQALEPLKTRLPPAMCWQDDGYLALHAPAAPRQPTDLLQGTFARRRRGLPWTAALLCVVASFALAWGFIQARSGFYEDQARSLYAISEQRFRALYPQQTRIVDLPAQLKALQQRHRPEAQGTQVARLLTLTEQVIGASDVDVQRIEYRLADGWKLHLTAASFAQLEQLRERGQASGLPIRLGSASQGQERVQAQLTLEPQP